MTSVKGAWSVIQEHDERDEELASGFRTEHDAWLWATEWSVYFSKRFGRYAFMRVKLVPGMTPKRVPAVPKYYKKDSRPWWKRLRGV